MNHWKQQRRDNKGRWLSYDGTRGKKYTARDIERAWKAGHNDQSRFMTIAQKVSKYLEMNGIR